MRTATMILLSCLALAACGEERQIELCTLGTQQACTCPDGLMVGTTTCQADGTYAMACTGCGMPGPMVMGDKLSQYVMSKLILPTSPMVAAYDLDGDGVADNRLGSIVQAISALDLRPQASTDKSIETGTVVILLEQISTDPTQTNAINAGARITRGLATTSPPIFDGSDQFTLDPADDPDQLIGDIVAGTFTSLDPASTTVPVELTLALPLIEGQPPVPLPITAARISFQRQAGGKLTGGQLNGAIRKEDVDALVLPAVAALITIELAKPNVLPSLATFDTDGNGVVTAAELKDNALIQALLAPDVAIFGAQGNFDPNPTAPEKDSLSLGVQFEAVTASF